MKMPIASIHIFCGLISPIRRWILCTLCLSLYISSANAQFAPVVGFPGTTAIAWDSSAFVSWASGCSIQRGYRDIAVPDSGYASVGDSASAIGPATQNGVVSLGDGGAATLTFASPIANGPGFDFAVFENGFEVGSSGSGLAFLELAFVEVSSDGIRYVRFPAIDNMQDSIQFGNGSGLDGSRLNNIAGKYVYGYGTPFDLDQLRDSAGLDVNNITHVKVIDVIGSINPVYGSIDSRGHLVNDPYPTNFASSGFDLDAVGVIHQRGATGIEQRTETAIIQVYPNPFCDYLRIYSPQPGMSHIQITDISGRILEEETFQQTVHLPLGHLPAGVYNVRVTNSTSVFSKLLVKE